jgi:hypothetical protein
VHGRPAVLAATSRSGSGLRAPIHVQVLAAFLVGERPRNVLPSDLQQVVYVQGPDLYTAARVPRRKLRAVWTEGDAGRSARVRRQHQLLPARSCPEQPNGAVLVSGRDQGSVRAEGDFPDVAGSHERGKALEAIDIPDLRALFFTGRHHPWAGGVEGDGVRALERGISAHVGDEETSGAPRPAASRSKFGWHRGPPPAPCPRGDAPFSSLGEYRPWQPDPPGRGFVPSVVHNQPFFIRALENRLKRAAAPSHLGRNAG